MTIECSGWPRSTTDFSISVAVGQACTQAPHDTHSDARNDSSMLGRDVRGKAATVDRQRERALNFFAGADAARADDALRRLELEVGVGRILRLEAVVCVPSARLANTWFSPS